MRKVFFSFHYQRDSWRVGQVRNCNVVKRKYDKNIFLDSSNWEQVKKGGEQAIKRWINEQLKGTSVTIVLIGSDTSERKYVNYEIEKSYEKGNGLLGIYIHNILDKNGRTDIKGKNPLNNWQIEINGQTKRLSEIFNTYDWMSDRGRDNIDNWIEEAANLANR